MTSEYMRASEPYRVAKGRAPRTRTVSQPRVGPPARRPTTQATGRVSTASTAESARTSTSPSPKTSVQTCNST